MQCHMFALHKIKQPIKVSEYVCELFFNKLHTQNEVGQYLCMNNLQTFLNVNILKKYYFLYVTIHTHITSQPLCVVCTLQMLP